MREICTSGSVGAPGRRRPGATRPLENTTVSVDHVILVPSTWVSSTGAFSFIQQFDVRVPIVPTYDQDLGLKTRRIRWIHNASSNFAGSMTSPQVAVVGWELGP